MDAVRKLFLPWTAEACFPDQPTFLTWLQKRNRRWGDLRAIFLLLAGLVLIAGYALDRYFIMVLTTAPLAVVLLLSLAMAQMDRLLDGQNKSEPTTKE